MEINDIEHKIACNELTAAQVFTQMKQHINECKCAEPLKAKTDGGDSVLCNVGLSDEAQKTYGSLIPGRWYQTIGHFPDVKELIKAGLVETEPSPLTWAKGPAVKKPKDT